MCKYYRKKYTNAIQSIQSYTGILVNRSKTSYTTILLYYNIYYTIQCFRDGKNNGKEVPLSHKSSQCMRKDIKKGLKI